MIRQIANSIVAKILTLSFFSLAIFAIISACCGVTATHAHMAHTDRSAHQAEQTQLVCPYTGIPRGAACATHIHGTPTAPLPGSQKISLDDIEPEQETSSLFKVQPSPVILRDLSLHPTSIILTPRELPKVLLLSSLPRSHIIA